MSEHAIAKKQDKPKLGLFPDMSFDDYRDAPGINNSGLKNLHRSPLTYITEKYHPRPETRANKIGHAFHCLVCEPEKFKSLYIKSKYATFQSKEAQIWKAAAEARGYCVLGVNPGADPFWQPSEWDLVHRMAESVRMHPIASILLSGGIFEGSIFWIDKKRGDYEGTGKLCKLRFDYYNEAHSCMVDLKSAEDASYSGFQRACTTFEYPRQDAWYTYGASTVPLDLTNGFWFVVAEKDPPYQVAIYQCEQEWVRQAAVMIEEDMLIYKQCSETNQWPGYGWRNETPVRQLIMPAYAKYHKIY